MTIILTLINFVRNKELVENEAFITAKIYSIEFIGRGSRAMDEEVAFYEFYVNKKRYSSHTSLYPKTEVGLCFDIKYSTKDPQNHKILEKNKYFSCK